MTGKSKTEMGSKGKSREELKTRALYAIGDVHSFDADTRRAVFVAPENLKLHEAEDISPPNSHTLCHTRYAGADCTIRSQDGR